MLVDTGSDYTESALAYFGARMSERQASKMARDHGTTLVQLGEDWPPLVRTREVVVTEMGREVVTFSTRHVLEALGY